MKTAVPHCEGASWIYKYNGGNCAWICTRCLVICLYENEVPRCGEVVGCMLPAGHRPYRRHRLFTDPVWHQEEEW